jgi:hypothetical protein
MARPNWTRGLSFTLDWQTGMPRRVLDTWEENIKFLDSLLVNHKLTLYQAFIHWHKDPDIVHYCGVTYLDEKRMAFCSGNDKETMLHEVAHLQYGISDHNERWADRLITLHRKYLKGSELKRADGDLAHDYTNAAKAFKKRFGTVPKRVKHRRRASVEELPETP